MAGCTEADVTRELTYRDLYREVNAFAAVRKKLDVGGGEGVHFAVKVPVGQLAGDVGLGGHRHQRQLIAAFGEVAIHRVVAEVCRAADEPAPEGRLVVLQYLLGQDLPVDQLRLLGPEGFGFFDGTAVFGFVAGHGFLFPDRWRGLPERVAAGRNSRIQTLV